MPARSKAAGRSAGRSGAGPDLEGVCEDLYTGAPGEFIARRDEQAAAAKAAGDQDTARAIRGLRKPSLSAWACNLLVRRQPEEARQFLQLGEALRRAHHEMDGSQMRELNAQQWRIISELARQAAGLAQEAGHRLSDAVQREVESTLRAAIADPEAAEQWSRGRLSSALTPPTGLTPSTAPSAPAERAEAAPPKRERPRADHRDELAERRRERQRRLAEARKAAKTAEAGLRDARKDAASADAASAEAEEREQQAQRAVAEAEDQLRQARDAHAEAETRTQDAETARRTAEDAVARAEQARSDAAAAVERLSR